jgi:L-alanine-DL-glutamate epimerase-like enolase superfamily enzyme
LEHRLKSHPTDITAQDAITAYVDFAYRTPMKFGGVPVTACTVLTAEVRVRTRSGIDAKGSGSMPLSAIWGFPSKVIPEPKRVEAMKRLCERIAALVKSSQLSGHPIEIGVQLESHLHKLSKEVEGEMALPEPIPILCALVCFSAFDAALHDAFGKAHKLHVYDCYGSDWMNADLSRYLDNSFKGEFPDAYCLRRPKPRLPLYHLVGALDALTDADVKERLNDGLPNTLGEWIIRDNLTHLKIKLNGNSNAWDVERILSVHKVATETKPAQDFTYSLDFNEQCPSVEYLLEVLERVKQGSSLAFDRAAYVEQPTPRDLKSRPDLKMHAAAKMKPVVIDESLVSYESLLLARDLGYSGVALKACKGQSQALLMAAAAQKHSMFLCVQDLTCPGQSFLHSAGLAAHIGPVTAIEGNSRQYIPHANREWAKRFPGVFTVTAGCIDTSALDRVGLGH